MALPISLRTSSSDNYSASNPQKSSNNAALSIQHEQNGAFTKTRIHGHLSEANWYVDANTLTNTDNLQLVATHSMAEPMPDNVYFSIGNSTLNISVPPLPKIHTNAGKIEMIIDCDPKAREAKVTVSYIDETGQNRSSSVTDTKFDDNELIDNPMQPTTTASTTTTQLKPMPVDHIDIGSLFAQIDAQASPEEARKITSEIAKIEPQLKFATDFILAQNLSFAQPGKGAPRTPTSVSMAERAAASKLTLEQQQAVYDLHERPSPPQDTTDFLQDFLFPREEPGYQRTIRHEPANPFREDGSIHEDFAWVVTESYVLNGDKSKALVQTSICPKDPHLPHAIPALNQPNDMGSIIGRLFAGSHVSQTTIRYSEMENQRQIAEIHHSTGCFLQNQAFEEQQRMVVLKQPDFQYQYSAVAGTNNQHQITLSSRSAD